MQILRPCHTQVPSAPKPAPQPHTAQARAQSVSAFPARDKPGGGVSEGCRETSSSPAIWAPLKGPTAGLGRRSASSS